MEPGGWLPYSQELFLMLSQMNPVRNFSPYFPKSIPILFSHLRLRFPSRLSDRNFVCISHLTHACFTPGLSNPPWLDHLYYYYYYYYYYSSSSSSSSSSIWISYKTVPSHASLPFVWNSLGRFACYISQPCNHTCKFRWRVPVMKLPLSIFLQYFYFICLRAKYLSR
jgi:hypothetical protein